MVLQSWLMGSEILLFNRVCSHVEVWTATCLERNSDLKAARSDVLRCKLPLTYVAHI